LIKKKAPKLTNDSFLRQTLSLETRKLQLKRQHIKLETQKVVALETISHQLTTMQTLFMAAHGIGIDTCTEQ
jgi:hypothetical protein